jgi:hypothetical protein
MMRMNGDAQPLWTQPMLVAQAVQDSCELFSLTPLADGEALACYFAEQLYLSCVNGNAVRWCTQIGGLPLPFVITPDNEGGAYLLNSQDDGAYHYLINMQHVDASGQLRWPGFGILFGDQAHGVEATPYVAPAGDGGIYVVWCVNQASTFDLYMQRLSEAGEYMWQMPGQLLHSGPTGTQPIGLCNDGRGNLFVAWTDNVNGNIVLRGKHVDSFGNTIGQWWQPDDGGLIADTLVATAGSVVPVSPGMISVGWTSMVHDPSAGYEPRFQLLRLDATTAAHSGSTVPSRYALSQNYPNPFNPTTQIAFALPKSGLTTLKVYDLLGREVTTLLDRHLQAGDHRINFDAGTLASGVYFYRLESGSLSATKKMLLLK